MINDNQIFSRYVLFMCPLSLIFQSSFRHSLLGGHASKCTVQFFDDKFQCFRRVKSLFSIPPCHIGYTARTNIEIGNNVFCTALYCIYAMCANVSYLFALYRKYNFISNKLFNNINKRNNAE